MPPERCTPSRCLSGPSRCFGPSLLYSLLLSRQPMQTPIGISIYYVQLTHLQVGTEVGCLLLLLNRTDALLVAQARRNQPPNLERLRDPSPASPKPMAPSREVSGELVATGPEEAGILACNTRSSWF
jgi:hypothetical protein